MAAMSCTVVKKAPGLPFHFENNIKIDGNLTKEQKNELENSLLAQIEDSLQIRVASKIPWPSFPFIIPVEVMEKPTVFKKEPIQQSLINMQNLMISMGYRKAKITYDTSIHTRKNQERITTNFYVNPGNRFLIDTVVFDFKDSALQSLAHAKSENAIPAKGAAFDYNLIDAEINRLTDLFQNNGFFKINKEDLVAEVDTNYVELYDAAIDPFELASRVSQMQTKKDQPFIKLRFTLRPNVDSTHFAAYRVGGMTIYPDLKTDEFSQITDSNFTHNDQIRVVSLHNTFHDAFIKENIAMKPGTLFKRDDYSKTLNNFNKLGTWQNINITNKVDEANKKIDYVLSLQPTKKQYFGIDLEGSSILNSSALSLVSSGRIGVATNFTLRNRNIGKRAIQLENSIRTGIEFNNFNRILSGETSLTNRITFPWLVAPVSSRAKAYFQQAKTIASVDFAYIDRFRFFNLNTFNTFFGYDWKPNPFTNWQIKPINFEYTRFRPDSLFLESISNFPLLLYTYNNGLIVGSNALFNRNITPHKPNDKTLIRFFAEGSGLLAGALFYNETKPGKSLSNLYRYFKFDAEIKHIIIRKENSAHFRLYAGAGWALSTGSRKGQVTLPFFKSFIAGGPNSMRGWPLRKLGIGSNIFYDTVANGTFNDKYADIQIEANAEYRFNLFPFYGFMMRGAVFTDAGNIWFRNDLDGGLKNAGFKFSRLGRDLAIASGFGARIDFNYFLLRFDLGFPIKDPRYGPDNKGNSNIERFYSNKFGGWFVDGVWHKPSFQFAIGYPF
jgi:outer membrane protein assembly factor BamA